MKRRRKPLPLKRQLENMLENVLEQEVDYIEAKLRKQGQWLPRRRRL